MKTSLVNIEKMEKMDGFNAAAEIAAVVPMGCKRRALKDNGEPANYCGYKDGNKNLWVLCDSLEDLADGVINDDITCGKPSIKIG